MNAKKRATTDVSAILTTVLAIPLYTTTLGLASIAPPGVRSILLERGWPPHATMALASVALAILVFKARALVVQRRAFGRELIGGVARLGPADAATLAAEMDAARGPKSFLVERASRVLAMFAANGEVTEAAAANEAESDADAATVAASFSTVKVIVWSMPILGLIGTVVGLSGAVGAFSSAMSGAEQLDAIKDSLRQVTTGLAVAFDATFVALIASIVVMLPMTWLQKAEDKLVGDVDDYCVTRILPRLAKAPQTGAAEAAPFDASELRVAIEQLTQLAQLGQLMQPLVALLSANAGALDAMAAERNAMTEERKALSSMIATLPSFEGVVAEIARATATARESSAATERAQDQLCRELGASRQLLSLLAAGMAPRATVNGTNGAAKHEG